MSQLQQRIPVYHHQQPIPITNVEVAKNETSQEEKIVVIGQNKPANEESETGFTKIDLSTTQQQETTEPSVPMIEKENKAHPALNEQELILLHEDPIVYHREPPSLNPISTTEEQERIPVTEDSMVKVELPEICSITGIGCRDSQSVPQQPEVVQETGTDEHPEVVQHPIIVPHPKVVPHSEIMHKTDEVLSTTGKSEEHSTEILSTLNLASNEQQTTNHDQLPSDSYQLDQQVAEHEVPVDIQGEHSNETQHSNVEVNHKSNITTSLPSNVSNASQEIVKLVVPHFNMSLPTVIHSVLSSVSEYVGSNNSSKHEIESSTTSKNSSDITSMGAQHVTKEAEFPLQQLQQVQQEQLYPHDHLSEVGNEHRIDEQKLLQIADSWSLSTDSNSTTQISQRRMDVEEKHKEVGMEESSIKHDMEKPNAVNFEHEIHGQMPQHYNNSSESPSIGDRIESYWKAATGYVSKALNL